jgi:hypothetical protein
VQDYFDKKLSIRRSLEKQLHYKKRRNNQMSFLLTQINPKDLSSSAKQEAFSNYKELSSA